MLEIKNITKFYNADLVLDNLSFNVTKGNIFGIIGPNGAGKTTTLRIVLGILSSTSGCVKFNGQVLNQDYLNFTGYLPEERGLYPKSSIFNILVYLGQLKGLNKRDSKEKVNYWLNKIDLIDKKNRHLNELSKGNQQKIQFVSAIFHDPDIIILDEPFSGFDPVNQSIFGKIINEIKNDKYIILSTHLMNLAENLCDEILLINNGKQIISGSLNNLLNPNNKNLFKIVFNNNKIDLSDSFLSNYKIIEKSKDSLIVNIDSMKPEDFLKLISNSFDVIEFSKIKLTLNQLFLSSIKKKINNE